MAMFARPESEDSTYRELEDEDELPRSDDAAEHDDDLDFEELE